MWALGKPYLTVIAVHVGVAALGGLGRRITHWSPAGQLSRDTISK